MTPSIKSLEYLYEITTGENGAGSRWGEREREKERKRAAD
jgi:hypothetical protein